MLAQSLHPRGFAALITTADALWPAVADTRPVASSELAAPGFHRRDERYF